MKIHVKCESPDCGYAAAFEVLDLDAAVTAMHLHEAVTGHGCSLSWEQEPELDGTKQTN